MSTQHPRLRDQYRRHPVWVGLAFGSAVLASLAQVVLPIFAGSAIDGRDGAISGLVVAAVLRYAFQAVRKYTGGQFSTRTQHELRTGLLASLQRTTGGQRMRLRSGQLVSRSISDLNQIERMLEMLPMAVAAMVEIVVIVVAMLWLSLPIALVILVQVPLLGVVVVASRRRLYAATWASQQQSADIATQVEESVTGIRVVKAFTQEERELGALRRLAARMFSLRMREARLTAVFQPVLSSLPNVGMVATIVIGGWLALEGHITVGEFLSASTFVTLIARTTRQAAGMIVTVQLASSAVSRVMDILALPARPTGTRSTGNATGIRGSIRTGPLDLDIDIEPGTTVGVRGPAGSGKTLLLHTLAGLHATDGVDLALTDGSDAVPLPDVRDDDRPTLVFDDPFLYSAPIRDNIRMGTNATDDEVRQAARAACAEDFIDELGGLDTVIGERGLTLSGGQRQRIGLARAFLRSPRILILDDATTAIDASTEARILDNLRNLHSAHSPSSPLTLVLTGRRHSAVELADVLIDLPEPARGSLWPTGSRTVDSPGRAADEPRERTREEADLERWATELEGRPDMARQLRSLPAAREVPSVPDYTAPFSLPSLLRLVRGLVIAIVGVLLLSVAADVTLPTLVRHAIDGGVSTGNMGTVLVAAGIALAVVLVSWAAQSATEILTSRAGERLLYSLRLRSYRHITGLDMNYFETTSAGRILTRMTTDIDTLSRFLQTGVSQSIVSVAMLAGVLVMLVTTNLALAGITALFIPVTLAAALAFRSIVRPLYQQARSTASEVNGSFHENVAGLATSEVYDYDATTLARFTGESDRLRSLRMKAQTAASVFFPGIQFLAEISQAVVLGFGTAMVTRGDISSGVLVAFSLYVTQLFGPIQQLSQVFDQFQQAKVSLQRISELLARRSSMTDGTREVSGTPSMDVTFGYGDSTVLDVDLEFHGTTALVGETGAGKSTVVKLLSRLYDPTTGAVRAGSTDLRDARIALWRRQLGVVPQEAHLFSGTVASNVAYGRPDATRDEITGAVERIGGQDIIATIPGGLSAPVRERGVGLSAGQRQIIALARAEITDPRILLLDEATASLNDDVEHHVVDAISAVSRGRTAVIVAHRLATAARADRIIVLDGGRVVESGDHVSLLEAGGPYARLWRDATEPMNERKE
ncbi:MAG: ABC transporter ATP-binding protein [Mycobacteriaceae bacterium]|uniref:ABC transporter ATP-binding protein n=1 Tax=Corynebacterium sp. TaxID=1720 RepID=UPI003F9A6704